jgi:hypothetical protein
MKRWAVWECGVKFRLRQKWSRGELLHIPVDTVKFVHADRIKVALRHGITWAIIAKYQLDYPWLTDEEFLEEVNALRKK